MEYRWHVEETSDERLLCYRINPLAVVVVCNCAENLIVMVLVLEASARQLLNKAEQKENPTATPQKNDGKLS